jgi:antitoxin component YwqK of YwqJK toxin-antitoxin module
LKIKIILLAVVIISILIPSCSEPVKKGKVVIKMDSIIYKPGTKEPFNGTWDDEFDSMRVTFDVVNGKKEGNFSVYYPNGKLQMSGKLKNNRNIGRWEYYFENGNLESAGNFENDKPEGEWNWYYPDQTLRQTGYFHLGKRDSIWKSYDEKGTLIDSVVISPDSTGQHLPL